MNKHKHYLYLIDSALAGEEVQDITIINAYHPEGLNLTFTVCNDKRFVEVWIDDARCLVDVQHLKRAVAALPGGRECSTPHTKKGGRYDAGILRKMPSQMGNERCHGHNHEEWQAGNSRCVSCLWDQDVQDRGELELTSQESELHERLAISLRFTHPFNYRLNKTVKSAVGL